MTNTLKVCAAARFAIESRIALANDKNGNLTDDGEKAKYIYNPWCQVVQVQTQASAVVANFRYNGLGMRISEQFDTNDSGNNGTADGVVDSNDPVFFLVNDMQGRRVGTFRGTSDSCQKETFVQHPAAIRGPAFRGGVLLRDREADLANPAKWATSIPTCTRSERMYPATDIRGSTVALVTAAGALVEQYRYSGTGVPIGIPLGDVNGDCTVNAVTTGTTDYTTVSSGVSPAPYAVRCDLNLDGKVDSADVALVTSNAGTTTGRGKLSRASVAWRSGWNGMEWQGTLGTYWLRGQIYDAVIGFGVQASSVACQPDNTDLGQPPAKPCWLEPTIDQCYACCNVQSEGSEQDNKRCRQSCGVLGLRPPNRVDFETLNTDCARDAEVQRLLAAARDMCAQNNMTLIGPVECGTDTEECSRANCGKTTSTRNGASRIVKICICTDDGLIRDGCNMTGCRNIANELINAWALCGGGPFFPEGLTLQEKQLCSELAAYYGAHQCYNKTTCCNDLCTKGWLNVLGFPDEATCKQACNKVFDQCKGRTP